MYVENVSQLNPFGSIMPTRVWSDDHEVYMTGSFRQKGIGKENDIETTLGNFPIGVIIGGRIYGERLGKWLNLELENLCFIDYSISSLC